MRIRALLICLLLACVSLVIAQDSKHTKAPKPPKPPKKKKHVPTVLILPVANLTGAGQEESDFTSLYARAGMLKVFGEKKIQIVSPAEVQAEQDQLGIDLKLPVNWTQENFDKIAADREADWVAAATLTAISDSAPDLGANPKKIAPSLTAMVTLSSWLYDVKNHAFLMQNASGQWSYTAKKTDEKLDQKAVNYQAVMDAIQHAFKDPVSKLKK
jgi:hypothetical protein